MWISDGGTRIMGKDITFDYLTQHLMEIEIPVTKKYKIVLNIREKFGAKGAGIYPPCLEIMCADKCVTDAIIKRNANQVIAPTAENIKKVFELLEELEYRMKAGKEAPSE
jgi:hypothetical protein